MRPTWSKVWMDFAKIISERSYDPRYKVGAIVVTGDNTQVLAVGYNGNYSGGPNEVESDAPGQSGMLHAEINCLLKMDYNNPKRKILYVTLSPCRMCAKAIINSGIDLFRRRPSTYCLAILNAISGAIWGITGIPTMN